MLTTIDYDSYIFVNMKKSGIENKVLLENFCIFMFFGSWNRVDTAYSCAYMFEDAKMKIEKFSLKVNFFIFVCVHLSTQLLCIWANLVPVKLYFLLFIFEIVIEFAALFWCLQKYFSSFMNSFLIDNI
jgi:hypothetical protein